MPWFDIGELDDFPAETSRERVVGDRIVAVCHTEGEIYALDGICPHQGRTVGQRHSRRLRAYLSLAWLAIRRQRRAKSTQSARPSSNYSRQVSLWSRLGGTRQWSLASDSFDSDSTFP